MLRIANYFESRLGRNDGNPLYVQACLKRMQYYVGIHGGMGRNPELMQWFANGAEDVPADFAAKDLWLREKQILEVDHLYPTGDLTPYGEYDLNIHVDWGEDALTSVLPYTPIVTPRLSAYWASDTHINNGQPGDSYPHRLATAKRSDFVFCAQKRAVDEMKRDGVPNPIWLPHAVEPQAYPKFDILTKKYDVCFVGHVNSLNREAALDKLFAAFPNFYYGQQLFEAAARKYAESKICFNMAMTDDLNMRNFEVMATGSFLLTSYLPDYEALGLIDGKHLVLYKDMDDCLEKARFYLEHDAERDAIAEAGYKEVIASHTIQHRVNVILDTFLKTKKQEDAYAGVQAR